MLSGGEIMVLDQASTQKSRSIQELRDSLHVYSRACQKSMLGFECAGEFSDVRPAANARDPAAQSGVLRRLRLPAS